MWRRRLLPLLIPATITAIMISIAIVEHPNLHTGSWLVWPTATTILVAAAVLHGVGVGSDQGPQSSFEEKDSWTLERTSAGWRSADTRAAAPKG